MRKINKLMWIIGLFLPSWMFAIDGGLDEGMKMVASTGTLFGVIIVVVTVAIWLLPVAFAGLVYVGQKKKAEQMHEEVGLKASILALLAGVLGAAMAFYIVGTIGKYAEGSLTKLEDGNGYLINKIIAPAIDQLEDNGTNTNTNTNTNTGGLDEGIDMVASTGKLFGMLIVVVAVSLWLLPIAFATLVYTGQKKKAEQMHEEVGLKAAVLALLAAVLGAAMAYYLVGSIGKYAEGGSSVSSKTNLSLESGNKYFLKAIIGTGANKITNK